MPLRLPPVQPRSRLAHEATKYAAAKGKFDAFHDEVFRAFFERGEDIGLLDLLVSLGENVGLDGGGLRQALATGEFTAKVVADEELAEHVRVNAVPAFVANLRRIMTGVRTADELRRFLGRQL